MQKILLTILSLMSVSCSFAQSQWATNGININNANTGNVGIGTINPGATLTTRSGLNSAPVNSGTNQPADALRVEGGDNAVIDMGTNSVNTWIQATDKTSLNLGYNLNLQPNGGNVGIGTLTPYSVLHIAATSNNQIPFSNTSPTLYGNENESLVFTGTNNASGGGILELLRLKVTSTNGGIAAGRVDFSQNGSSTPTLSFTPNKYVGIGTTQPDQALTVLGTIHATEVLVDQNVPHPDYVFDKDYDLTSLKDVKTYIEKNHHLPEILSAAQVVKEGINLGEMNTKLLKKIEELTLYLIEKDDQLANEKSLNTSQQQQIDQLKVQMKDLLISLSKK